MSMEWTAEWVAAGAAVAAAIVSVLSMLVTIRMGRGQAERDKQARAMHERAASKKEAKEQAAERARERRRLKADLVSEIGHLQSPHFLTLAIENFGFAPARDVLVFLDGVAMKEHDLFRNQRPLPPEQSVVGPGDRVFYRFQLSGQSPESVLVSLRWTDDSGEPGGYQRSHPL